MFPVLLMIGAGVAVAFSVIVGIGIAQRAGEKPQSAGATREAIAASLLYNVLIAGGDRPDEAMRDIRRDAGLGAAPSAHVDMMSWGERFAQMAPQAQREWLLETAVRLVASRQRVVPLRQYNSLLDLSFALGFHTDALAHLRDRYPFEYIDHAKNGRPREADRAGGSTPLFVREQRDAGELLRVLGIEGQPTRQIIISTYRRLAAQHHPDRVFGEAAEVQSRSAARFIEITRAYEALLAIYREDV
jgi:hypothetical protein